MFLRSDRRHVFMDNAPAEGAPAGGDAPAAPAAPAPSPPESLLRAPAAPAPAPGTPDPAAAPAPAAPAEFDYIPEKYRVTGADGKLDLTASTKKLADGYSAAAKRIGTGDLPPETPAAYTFTVPDALKDSPVDEVLSPFRERAHKAGLTQAQFEFVAGEYFELVPQLLDGAAKVSAEQARTELQKVWPSTSDYEKNLSASQRAVAALPPELQAKVHEKYGTDPLFLQAVAHLGREMREDSPPPDVASGRGGVSTVEQLMASPAYRDLRHPEHAAVSARVRAMNEKAYGTAPAM